MQVLPVQHPANLSIPHKLLDPTPRPSTGSVPPGLLQLPASWPPASAIRPLQLIQNAAARLIFNAPKHTHTTRLLSDLHWLPVIARIKFKTLVLAYQAIKGSAPAYIQQFIRPYTPARPLRSATSGRLAPPARHTCTAHSWLLSVLAPRWWNDLPVDVRTAETLSTFKRRLKTHLFRLHLSLPPSLVASRHIYDLIGCCYLGCCFYVCVILAFGVCSCQPSILVAGLGFSSQQMVFLSGCLAGSAWPGLVKNVSSLFISFSYPLYLTLRHIEGVCHLSSGSGLQPLDNQHFGLSLI